MRLSKLNAHSDIPLTHLATLMLGDLLVILSFVWIGRSSHHFPVDDIGAALFTALPFIMGWFLITPWFGLYTTEVNQNWRKLLPRLLIAWGIGGMLALVLRALFLGRPILASLVPTFAVISLGYIGLLALLLHLGYGWWMQRSLRQPGDMSQARG
jgi:hypothetical protein